VWALDLKILVDMLTPKQALFLGELSNKIEDKGHNVVRVTRRFHETLYLLRLKKIKAKIIGTYRLSLEGKLHESLKRTSRLARLIKNLGVDLVLAYPSVEAARAAYGLSIPYYCVSDSPHAEAVSRLTVPLAKRLFSPAIIPKEDWIRYGISKSKIIQYNALDPCVWIKNLKKDPKILRNLGLDPKNKLIILRLEETFAAYLLNKQGDWRNLASRILDEILKKCGEARIIVLPRYNHHYELLKEFKGKVIVPKKMVYGPALLAFSSVFIGGGGTMTAEAALLGVPTISYFPSGPTYVESYLQEKGLLTRNLDPKSISQQISNWIDDDSYQKTCQKKAQEILGNMEDPLQVILENID
jgi:predicted glycosyltransferase